MGLPTPRNSIEPAAAAAGARILARTPLPMRGCAAVPDIVAFAGLCGGDDSVALVFPGTGEPGADGRKLVRLHSACVTGDVFGSQRCDCGAQLEEAVARCAGDGGIILYLDQEGRGIGLARKVQAYALQHAHGIDTFAANRALGLPEDARGYRGAAEMLRLLDAVRIRLLSGSPRKLDALRACGIDAVLEPGGAFPTRHNRAYLEAKRRAGHLVALEPEEIG